MPDTQARAWDSIEDILMRKFPSTEAKLIAKRIFKEVEKLNNN